MRSPNLNLSRTLLFCLLSVFLLGGCVKDDKLNLRTAGSASGSNRSDGSDFSQSWNGQSDFSPADWIIEGEN